MLSTLGNWKYVRVLEEDFVEEEKLNGFHRHKGTIVFVRWEENFRRRIT